MCGIVGFFSTKQLDETELLASLKHRGPNSNGFHHFKTEQQHIGIGHTRLSILDLSEKGKQPMVAENEQVVITFNGEIYNFQELKFHHLKQEIFQSETDTEVILKLYLKFGLDFVNLLNGDFAFGILDKRIDQLFLVRDRVGVKPLYYYHKNQFFTFASEIKTLLKAGVPKKVNLEEIQNYFVFKYSPKEQTLFQNVKRLKPGNILSYDYKNDSVSISSYWELKKIPEINKISFEEAKIEVKNLLTDSIKLRLIADVPIANFLSGGLDSSIIAYHLKENKEIHHYCATKNRQDLLKEGSTSDGKYAQMLAEKWNLNLTMLPISSNETNEELIKKTLYFSDDLIADGSQIPSYIISQKASETSKVILSGMGADELFLGYAGHQISLLSDKLDHVPSFLKFPLYKWMSKLNQGKGKFLAYRRYLHKLGKNADLGRLKFAHFNIVGDVESARSIFQQKGNSEEIFSSYFLAEEANFDNIFHFEFENFLQKNLHYLDRMSMANGVEGRVPFLDYRLIEFAYNLPLSYKLSDFGNTKRILKEAYKNQLPGEITNRRKAGFGMPLRSIFSDKEQVYRLLNLEFFASFDGFSIEHIQNIIELHINGKEDQSALIYALISFQNWYQLHIEN